MSLAHTERETPRLGLKPRLLKGRGSVHNGESNWTPAGTPTRLIAREKRAPCLMPTGPVLPAAASPAEAAGCTPASRTHGEEQDRVNTGWEPVLRDTRFLLQMDKHTGWVCV